MFCQIHNTRDHINGKQELIDNNILLSYSMANLKGRANLIYIGPNHVKFFVLR